MSLHQTEADQPDTPKRRSWRLRWSLRVLIGIVTLACVLLGWGAYYFHQGQVHEDAAKQLQQLGAEIQWKLVQIRRTTYAPFPFLTHKVKGGPAWMQAWGVEPAFQRIDRVILKSSMSPHDVDAALQQIHRLGAVKTVSCFQVEIDESQFITLLESVEIETLYMDAAQLGPGNLPYLRTTNLRELTVAGSAFSDAAIDDLPQTLEYFDATRTRITDQHLAKFAERKNLQTLKLGQTHTSKTAVDKLRSQMPWCAIHWEPLEQDES